MTADPIRWAWAAAAVVLWLALIGLIALRRARRTVDTAPTAPDATLVVFASQTGFAEELVRMTAAALNAGGVPTALISLGELTIERLAAAPRALFLVSTTGEGDAPDSAVAFLRRMNRLDLSGLSFGVLALGDRSYSHFCAFGRALDDWLRTNGARPLFDRVEVDNGEAGAIRHWQHQLSRITGLTDAPDWAPPAYTPWRLMERERLNSPDSPGEGLWRIALEPVGEMPDWRAGDIAEIGVPSAPGQPPHAHREYSVASLPADGRLELIVRLMRGPDGTPGLASGWLTDTCAIGAPVDLRIRSNSAFHGPEGDPPMILIGAGSGLAGLRAHLRERQAAGCGANWLILGERHPDHDRILHGELEGWCDDGALARLDCVFSRGDGGRYVQNHLRDHADLVRDWIARGAVIHVCGAVAMGAGVHEALGQILGVETLDDLTARGRYRRDVY
ncbi:flavodoxin domain-containing protein [Brevundimonas sp. BAL450]|uniref:NADPH--hemoprotein reductase n=1 Tax=Brevundimonas abyssalis TAR-001 TaxID=1391729 RepID=A0A8E0KHV1_9CAUL|nr:MULTISPECIES: sulfite reductase subunit alpha [Brevundimonas]MBG7614738.1 flavodoxin domain-containing protein [Brevundimonas sp. BAL450]GAD58461.1 probable oxidoreductase [Brevundimonas abyssalis TAR-001]